jgi:hypothetical protein
VGAAKMSEITRKGDKIFVSGKLFYEIESTIPEHDDFHKDHIDIENLNKFNAISKFSAQDFLGILNRIIISFDSDK